ncbi:MAG: AAA family ATPase [Phycisphaerae bacterium]
MAAARFQNPFRPGAGHMPPYLAGREEETREFRRLLEQTIVFENLVLTGLRGVGKTVLLDTLKPLAMGSRWMWAAGDMSESASVNESSFATRLITDLSVVTSGVVFEDAALDAIGFRPSVTIEHRLNYAFLSALFEQSPGLVSDKLKAVLEFVWSILRQCDVRGIIFAYDEAQNMSDHAAKEQYPLSILLDVFQSIQRKDIPFMLVLSGLPTLFPKLVETRTYSERMFRVVFLRKLGREASREAITRPIQDSKCPVKLRPEIIDQIVDNSGGYPYFIQFICREVYDSAIQKLSMGELPGVPMVEIIRKLDADFFAGRWARVTDRQRELLWVIASIEGASEEFSIQEVVERSRAMLKSAFSPSHANQMIATLGESGLVYRNRHGKYAFAVPLFGQFVKRQMSEAG